MDFVYGVLLVLFNTFALFLVILGLPGTWLMALVVAFVAWLRWEEQMISLPVVVVVAAIALVAEVLDLVAAGAGARRAGSTRWGATGGVVGGIIGAIAGTPFLPVPILGTILAGCIGAFVGAVLAESLAGRPLQPSMRSGRGAVVGRLAGTAIKLGAGLAMWLVIAVAAFWP